MPFFDIDDTDEERVGPKEDVDLFQKLFQVCGEKNTQKPLQDVRFCQVKKELTAYVPKERLETPDRESFVKGVFGLANTLIAGNYVPLKVATVLVTVQSHATANFSSSQHVYLEQLIQVCHDKKDKGSNGKGKGKARKRQWRL